MRRIRSFKEDDESDTVIVAMGMIDVYFDQGNYKKADELIALLKTKYGVDYSPYGKDDKVISLDHIYTSYDFTSWRKYVDYCEEIFKLRFREYRGLLNDKDYGNIPTEQAREILKPLGIPIEEMQDSRKTGLNGFVKGSGDTININTDSRFYKGGALRRTIVHESGHIFENRNWSKVDKNGDILRNLSFSSSSYGLLNGAEVFAEHFTHYFTEGRYLKEGWPEVYKLLDKMIDSKWKKAMFDILEKK